MSLDHLLNSSCIIFHLLSLHKEYSSHLILVVFSDVMKICVKMAKEKLSVISMLLVILLLIQQDVPTICVQKITYNNKFCRYKKVFLRKVVQNDSMYFLKLFSSTKGDTYLMEHPVYFKAFLIPY